MSKKKKTNAIRLLERQKIAYEIREFNIDDGLMDGLSVAEKTGQKPNQVFKTLVTQGEDRNICVFCLPVSSSLDLKKAAKAAGAKRIRMIPMQDLLARTGYVHGGCSPVGMKKRYPTWIDQSAMGYDKICISGGARGLQVCLAPKELQEMIDSQWADLIEMEGPL